MPDKHFSSQFEGEIHDVSARLTELGHLVDRQICQVIDALVHFDAKGAQQVLAAEAEVNALEVEIDHEITSIIAKRQPVALDLRLLMAMSKASSNLERIGNEIDRIAQKVIWLIHSCAPGTLPSQELSAAAKLSTDLLRQAMTAFARLDLAEAMAVIKQQKLGHREVDEFIGKLVKPMMENLRVTSYCVELISMAKSLELITDHARHIAELVVYVVEGADVRHLPVEKIESVVK